jgi:hypothetical protein
MSKKIPSQDSNSDEINIEDIIKSYKEAAECDEYLFGDYDYCKEWMKDTEGQ